MAKRNTPPSHRVVDDANRATRAFDSAAAALHRVAGGIAHEVGELHRLLVESVQDYAIFALDQDGYILSWNAGAQRFKGYTADEIIGKHFSIFYPESRVAEKFPEFELREAARVGRFEDHGWRIRKDGTRFWAHVIITALRDQTGALVGYAKVTRDLTERRAAEDALRLSEERFRLLVQGVKDYAIFMLEPDGCVATWNEGAQRIKGYRADEIIGKHFSVFYPPDKVAERFPQYELEMATRNGQFEDEGWRLRRDGSRFWANVLITALRNADGDLIGFSKVTRDLTERRAAEQRAMHDATRVAAEEAARHAADLARRRTERLQLLTSALSAAYTLPEILEAILVHGIAVLGADAGALGLLDASRAYVDLVGRGGRSDVPDWKRRFPLNDSTPIGEAIGTGRTVIAQSGPERDARFPAAAELLREYETSVAVPLVNRGSIIGALAMHRRSPDAMSDEDLTLLEAFAEQCAQAIERARLYEGEQQARREAEEARARADEANRAKSEFLAAMSHELRTPLNAIAGYTELLTLGVRGPVTLDQQQDLERIQRSQQHLLGIINDLLNYSRIEAGQMEYTFSTTRIRDVLESVKHMIAPQAMAKGLNFAVLECSPETAVWIDRAKTEQVLLNLLSNAVKFTAPGGDVTLACDERHARHIELAVRDTGSGIEADQLERIFEPFVQLGRSLTNIREGTGLGLAISRDLARAMNGDILVESVPGEGSSFTLSLPRSAEDATDPSPQA